VLTKTNGFFKQRTRHPFFSMKYRECSLRSNPNCRALKKRGVKVGPELEKIDILGRLRQLLVICIPGTKKCSGKGPLL